MPTKDLKFAAYLDEAGEDAASSCAVLKAHDIHYAALRHVWAGNICDVDDATCQQVRSLLTKNDISVVAIMSDVGKVPVNQLASIPPAKLARVFNIASYFGASHIRFHIGTKSSEPIGNAVNSWMQLITDKCLEANVTPLFELTGESCVFHPTEVAAVMMKFRRWKLLYDPVQLILRQNQDPFTRYWTLLKNLAGAIDVRDYKVGHGFKPVGFGDARIGLTLKDAIATGFQGWYYLEPSLGRRHGGAVSKGETFHMAMEALDVLLSST